MKNTIFILVCLLFIKANAQDRYPDQKPFNTLQSNGGTTYINSENDEFKQKHLIKGWHWDGNPYLSDSMNYNQSEIQSCAFEDASRYPTSYYNAYKNMSFTVQLSDSRSLINSPIDFASGWSHNQWNELMNFKSMQFEAAFNPETNKSYKEYKDNENPIFGFRYRLDTAKIVNDNGNILIYLGKIDDDAYRPVKVLAEPYPDMLLKSIQNKESSDTNDSIYYNVQRNFCGNVYHFSIRIKCNKKYLDPIDSTEVLRIRLPFKKKNGDIEYIKFAKIPDPVHGAIDIVRSTEDNSIMGRRRRLKSTLESNCTELSIPRSMLFSDDSNHTDYRSGVSREYRDNYGWVTLHALIVFKNGIANQEGFNTEFDYGNPRVVNNFSINDFSRIGVEIVYNQNTNIWIDWVRFETPHTHNVLWGKYDRNICSLVKYAFNNISDAMKAPEKKNRLFRFTDIIEGDMQNWQGKKYLKRLIGDVFVGEADPYLGEQYSHYTEQETQWLGMFLLNDGYPVPFIKYGFVDYGGDNIIFDNYGKARSINWRLPSHYTIGYGKGAYGFRLSHLNFDPNHNANAATFRYNYEDLKKDVFSSNYDTYCYDLGKFVNSYEQNKISYYDFINLTDTMSRCSIQQRFEKHISQHYDEKFKHLYNDDSYLEGINAGFIYNDKPWWGQTFSIANFALLYDSVALNPLSLHDSVKNVINQTGRQLTAEELRLIQNNYMIMGAKGVMLDGQGYGFTKHFVKQLYFDNDVNPLTDTIIRTDFDKPWWNVYKPRQRYWVERNTLANYGLIRNPELGDDFLGEWHKNVMTWAAFTKKSRRFENLGYTFFRNAIGGDREVVSDRMYPQNKYFGNPLDTAHTYQTISKLCGLNYTDDQHCRIYVGMRSARMETTKLYRYLSTPEVDYTLMNSKLAGWIGKGFRRISNYDENKFSKTPLVYIIDTSRVKTYKIKGYDFSGNTSGGFIIDTNSEQDNNQRIDSGFYDITILRKTNPSGYWGDDEQSILRGGFVLCVQNRRTDPLTVDSWLHSVHTPFGIIIDDWRAVRHFELTDDSLDVFSKERINFLSQAEYDDRLIKKPNPYTGSEKEIYEHFGNMYWSKFGARQIVIPLLHLDLGLGKFKDANNQYRHHYGFKIRELGSKDTNLSKEYWRNGILKPNFPVLFSTGKFYFNLISLKVCLQPGEARYFLVEPIYQTSFKDDECYPRYDEYKKTKIEPKFDKLYAGGITKFSTKDCPEKTPITVKVLKKNVDYEIAVALPANVEMYNEVETDEDTVHHTIDTCVVYKFYVNNQHSADSIKLFNLYHNETNPFPVQISYVSNIDSLSIVMKDTVIYFDGDDHLKSAEKLSSELIGLRDIKIIPNPCSNKFEVQFYSFVKQDLTLSIADNSGKIVLNKINYSATIGECSLKINTENLTSGNYFLIVNDGNSSYQQKFTVIK